MNAHMSTAESIRVGGQTPGSWGEGAEQRRKEGEQQGAGGSEDKA